MTSNPNKPTFNTDRSRLFKDRFAKFGITAGGIMVLIALLLIFFYLLYVVQPIFESAKVEKRAFGNQVLARSIELFFKHTGLINGFHYHSIAAGGSIIMLSIIFLSFSSFSFFSFSFFSSAALAAIRQHAQQ